MLVESWDHSDLVCPVGNITQASPTTVLDDHVTATFNKLLIYLLRLNRLKYPGVMVITPSRSLKGEDVV